MKQRERKRENYNRMKNSSTRKRNNYNQNEAESNAKEPKEREIQQDEAYTMLTGERGRNERRQAKRELELKLDEADINQRDRK